MLKFLTDKIVLLIAVIVAIRLHSNVTPEIVTKPNADYYKYLGSHVMGYIHDYILVMSNRLGIEEKEYDYIVEYINISKPIVFQKNKNHPIRGEWYHRVKLTDDKQTWIFNISFEACYNASPKIIPRVMGTTNATLILERDILEYVEKCSFNHCTKEKKEEFYNTFMVIDSYEIPGPKWFYKKDAIYEKWIVQACGKKIPYIIEILPDGNGALISL